MTDYFALLNEARRPWIDPDLLKEKYLALSAQFHPDRFHQSPEAGRKIAGEHYAEINAAYNCLREPRDRLRHLLELELGAKPSDIQQVPADMMNSMFEIGQLCKQVDLFITDKSKVTSPILKVQCFERGHDWAEKLNSQQQGIQARRDELLRELATMNSAWESASTVTQHPFDRLDAIYRLLGYLGRWSEQLQERIVQLSF